MDTSSSISNTSNDFIAFSDSDCSPNVDNKSHSLFNNYYKNVNRNNSNHYNNNVGRNYNNSWNSHNMNKNNQHWYRNNNKNKYFKRQSYQYQQQGSKKNRYLHWSFTEDPWANLMKQLKERNNEDDSVKSDKEEST